MSSPYKLYVVGNWKMQGSQQMIEQFRAEWLLQLSGKSKDFEKIEVILCPPASYLSKLQEVIQEVKAKLGIGWKLGAQNASYALSGAYTGEISPVMLAEVGCQYVLLGHSDRRRWFAEEDGMIARKWLAAYDAGLLPILCVGETEQERGLEKTFEIVGQQLKAVLGDQLTTLVSSVYIAYEPVWAIGTGIAATPEQVQAVHTYIKGWINHRHPALAGKVQVLYGGSVKASNALDFLVKPDIDGVLVGGASLNAVEFLNICQSAITGVSWNKSC